MNIGAQLIFRRTQRPRQHSIRPWIHNLSHQRNALATIREIQFPDIVPRQDIPLRFVAGDFLDLFREDAIYDAVVTLFFIDTVSHVDDTIARVGLNVRLHAGKQLVRLFRKNLAGAETRRCLDKRRPVAVLRQSGHGSSVRFFHLCAHHLV